MIKTLYVYLLLGGYAFLILGYYFLRNMQGRRVYYSQDAQSLESLKQEVAEKGYSEELLDFWVQQDFSNRGLAMQRHEESTIRQDFMFGVFCIMTYLLLVILLQG